MSAVRPDSWRKVRVRGPVAERITSKLRQRSEFTVLVTLKQERLNSGVLLSIHDAEQSVDGCYGPREGVTPLYTPLALQWQCTGLWVVRGHHQVKRAHFSLRGGLALRVRPCSVGVSQPTLRCAASGELIRSTSTARQDRS
ncbi:unnamed protein product [Arctogadus glacialis]